MIPVLLPLLLSATLSAGSANTPSGNSTGKKHIVAFPENIAYFYPNVSRNMIYITAVSGNPTVTVSSAVHKASTKDMKEGQTERFLYDEKVELSNAELSDRSFQITSTQEVSVFAASFRSISIQTARIIPNDKLGRQYFIPPVPITQLATIDVYAAVTERQPFKLIIINTDKQNSVSVEADYPQTFSLTPHQVLQVYIQDNTYRAVTADHPVAVLFGHTCALRHTCLCSLLYATLSPNNDQKLKYYVPSVVSRGVEDETYLLSTDEGSPKEEKFDSESPLVETAGTAILFRPGLLLNLIPETDFAACYLVNGLPGVGNFSVIVVRKDASQGVHIGKTPLVDPQWEPMGSTGYVSTRVSLNDSAQTLIWHSFSTMGVYYQGESDQLVFGNPATVISKYPDYRGCVTVPEEIIIGDAGSWQESVEHCRNKGMELISFPNADHQRQVLTKINQEEDPNLWEVWIGMRRRSLYGWWYWLNQEPISQTNWAEGEPGNVEEGQCAIMSAQRSKNFGWRDEDCCVKARPVCYKHPVFFNINPPGA